MERGDVYAALAGRVFKSTDHGEHWLPAGEGLPQDEVLSLAVFPSEREVIYARTERGTFVSADAGASWRPASHVPSTRDGIESVVGHLATDRIPPPVVAHILATLDDRAGGLSPARFDWGDLVLRAHPGDPRRLYLGTRLGLYASSDGGITWASSMTGIVASEARVLIDVPGSRGDLFAVTRRGIHRTTDGGSTWTERSQGLENSSVVALAVDSLSTGHLYAVSGDGRLHRSADYGASWSQASGSLPREAPPTGLVVAHHEARAGVAAILYVGTDGAGVFRSLDQGESWESLSLSEPRVGAIWLAGGEGDQDFIYVGAGRDIYRRPVEAHSTASLSWQAVTSGSLRGRVTCGLVDPAQDQWMYFGTDAGDVYGIEEGIRWINLSRGVLPPSLKVEALALTPLQGKRSLLWVIADGRVARSGDEGRTWSFSDLGCFEGTAVRSVAVDDCDPETIYFGTREGGVYRAGLGTTRASVWSRYRLAFAGLGGVVLVLVALWVATRRHARPSRAAPAAPDEEDREEWNRMITDRLAAHDRVVPEMLGGIPEGHRASAMRRYVDRHKNLDLAFQEEPPAIHPTSHLPLGQFVENWALLVDRLGSVPDAVPVAARVAEQLCELLGFSPLESRTYRSLFGYMVSAPAVRLSIPPRFPVVFLLQSDPSEQDVRDARDLMSVLKVNSFFALLVVVDQAASRRQGARELRGLLRGGADDFIVLDYRDLRSLFLAADPVRRLVDLILSQVDLTVVSPYVVSGPVAEKMFFGRDYELKAIMRTVRDHSFAVVGGRKIGKTSVLHKAHRLMDESGGLYSLYLDCQHVMDHDEFFGTLAAAGQVQLDPASPGSLRRTILRLLRQHNAGVMVLLLDEVDRLLAFDTQRQKHLFRLLRATSQEGLCRYVFCGERRLSGALHDPDSPLFNFCSVLRLSYLPSRDAARVIREPMASIGVSFEDSEALVEGIIELSSCHPNIVQAICQMLIVRIDSRGERIIRMDDLAAVRASEEFRDLFLEVTWGNATPLERLISVLMVNAGGFSRHDVKQALAAYELDVANAAIESALKGLVLFSMLQKQAGRYQFAARAFPAMMEESRLAEGLIEGLLEKLRMDGLRER